MNQRKNYNSLSIKMGLSHFLLESQFWFPIWVIFLLQRNFSLNQIVIADMVFRTSIVVLEFPLGVLGDKIGRKKTYFLGAAFGIFTYLILIITTNFLLLIICWIFWAIYLSLISGTNTAYRYELLASGRNKKNDIRIFGVFNSIAAAALLLSHTSGGYLYSIKPSLPIWVNLFFALLASILILSLPKTDITSNINKNISLKKMIKSFTRLIENSSSILPLIIILALWTAYHWTPTLIFQPLLKDLGIADSYFGIVFAAFTGMGIISGLITGKLTTIFGKYKIIIAGLTLQVIAISLTAFMHNLFLIISGIILLRFSFNLCEPILSVMLNRRISNGVRASIISLVNLIASLIMIFSRPLLGFVTSSHSTDVAFKLWFYIGIGFFIISIFLLYSIYRRSKKKVS